MPKQARINGENNKRSLAHANSGKQLIKDDYQVGVETMPAGTQK